MIDYYAPIIPYVGMAGILLYSKEEEVNKIVSLDNAEKKILNDKWIRYDIDNAVELFFHKINGKLFRITTLGDYKGKLFEKIKVGMTVEDLIEYDSSFYYDEFEEVYESDKGIFIETDPQTNTVKWISVYIKELDDKNFDDGQWWYEFFRNGILTYGRKENGEEYISFCEFYKPDMEFVDYNDFMKNAKIGGVSLSKIWRNVEDINIF